MRVQKINTTSSYSNNSVNFGMRTFNQTTKAVEKSVNGLTKQQRAVFQKDMDKVASQVRRNEFKARTTINNVLDKINRTLPVLPYNKSV